MCKQSSWVTCKEVSQNKHALPRVRCPFSHLDMFIHTLNTEFWGFFNTTLRWKEDFMQNRCHPSELICNSSAVCKGWLMQQLKQATKQGQRAGSKGPGTVSHCGESSTPGMGPGVLKSSPSPERGEILWVYVGGCVCVQWWGTHSSLGHSWKRKSLSQNLTFRNIHQDLLRGVLAFVSCLLWSHTLFPLPAQMPPITQPTYPNNSFSTMCMSYQASRCYQRSCDPHTNLRMVIPPAWPVLPAVGSPQWGQ